MKKAFITIFLVLFFDQLLKIWIKTTMVLGQEIPVLGDWFLLHFTENKGMAFGMEISGEWGKLLLSIFRIIAIGVIGWYLLRIIHRQEKSGLIISISLIFAGAVGNMIDSAFYGMVFTESYHNVASVFPADGGYSSFLHGKVVDMLYFPLVSGTYPHWLPLVGGDSFSFFRPVFNIADSAITVGVFILLLFQRKFFPKEKDETDRIESAETD